VTGIGVLSKEDAAAFGLVGPIARGSGIGYDVRRAFPYLVYDRVEFDVPVRSTGDVWARFQVRMQEIGRASGSAGRQIEKITPTGPWAVDDPRITPPRRTRSTRRWKR